MSENIFSYLASASNVLKERGLETEIGKMFERVTASENYHEALKIIFEYVQMAVSTPEPASLKPEDIEIDPEFLVAWDGVTAYVETWFDTGRRFDVELGPDDSIDLYATYQPETGEFSPFLHIKRDGLTPDEIQPAQLLPPEQSMILQKMEECAEKQHTSLKDLYAAWKSEQGKQQTPTKKKEKKHQHER